MANLHKFDLQTLPAMAWKNGGGVTREIVREPTGASLDDFDWRVSVADIAAAGPFSRFVGIDRHLLLLEGDGVHLTSAEAGLDVNLLADDTVLAFSGDVDMSSQLLGGAVRDFNVMTKRGVWQAQVSVWTGAASIQAQAGLVLQTRGQARCLFTDGDATLQAGQGGWWQGQMASLYWQPLSTDAKAIVVVLQSVNV
jgi:environmental stress-induced protein Ves